MRLLHSLLKLALHRARTAAGWATRPPDFECCRWANVTHQEDE